MIAASNRRTHLGIEFTEYLTMPGYSYSGLKNEGRTFASTEKMKLGTLIHNFLFEPQNYQTGPLHETVKAVGAKVLSIFGSQWNTMQFEVCATADFAVPGIKMQMPYKGRLDIHIPNTAVIDLKVSEVPLAQSIPHFGYDNQLSGYGLATGIDALFIVRVNPKRPKEIEIKQVARVEEFWVNSIILKGQVARD